MLKYDLAQFQQRELADTFVEALEEVPLAHHCGGCDGYKCSGIVGDAAFHVWETFVAWLTAHSKDIPDADA